MKHGTSVLVTGVAGFIGSHVAERCLELGFDVVGADDLSGGRLENVPRGVRFVQGDVSDPDVVASLFRQHTFEYVYHLAAYAAEGLSHYIRLFNYKNNVLGSANLINASINNSVSCFVFASSIAVYGENQVPMTEDLSPRPEDPYGIAKFAVELDLAAAQRHFGLPFVIFRPHNVYGERQNLADRYRNVIGIFMNQTMQNLPLTIFGDGSQTRAFSHITDVAPLIARAPLVSQARNEIFNIGADTPYTVLQLARTVASAFGREPRVTHLPGRKEVAHAFANHEKVKNCFGAPPTVDLAEGVKLMAKWALSIGPSAPSTFKGVEVKRGLPPVWAAVAGH